MYADAGIVQGGASPGEYVEVPKTASGTYVDRKVPTLEVAKTVDEEKVLQSCQSHAADSTMVVLVTGAGGFVGYHTSMALHERGTSVLGLDNFNDYYPPTLKRDRQLNLMEAGVHVVDADLNDQSVLEVIFSVCQFTHVLHLAAQAGVRYAVKNPGAYVHSNVAGFVTLMEVVRVQPSVPIVVFASSSSVYGTNKKTPFSEDDRTDNPASLYAATKKADEMLAHTYNNIYGISITALRFFTVYGPYGRPDMAYFSFANNIMLDKPIKIFQGPGGIELGRDFTYISDIVAGAIAALDKAAPTGKGAPFKIYNLGNTHPVNVTAFVNTIEHHLGKKAIKKYVPMPATGDVLFTHADVSKAQKELGYMPTTSLSDGIRQFVEWYKVYYKNGQHKEQQEYVPA